MTGGTRPCPSCGAPLPQEASFCPYCMETLRHRREAEPPVRRWLKPVRQAVLPLVLAALAAAAFLLYDVVTPDTYDAWGELTYTKPLTKKEWMLYKLLPSSDNPDIRKPPIAEQLKEAGRLAQENRGQPGPKKDAPDRGNR